MTLPQWPFSLDVNIEVEPYSNILIGGAILYTFIYLQMPGRCRLPSTINLAVMILFAYGCFLNLASHRMTHSLERRTANLHYGLPSLQRPMPRYRRPNIRKIGMQEEEPYQPVRKKASAVRKEQVKAEEPPPKPILEIENKVEIPIIFTEPPEQHQREERITLRSDSEKTSPGDLPMKQILHVQDADPPMKQAKIPITTTEPPEQHQREENIALMLDSEKTSLDDSPMKQILHLQDADPPVKQILRAHGESGETHVPPARGTAMVDEEESPELIDKLRKEWYDVIQTNPMYKSLPPRPLRVALITRDLKAGPTNHVMMDGLENSEHLELVGACLIMAKHGCKLNANDPSIDLWLIDANGIKTKAEPGDLVHQLLNIPNPEFQMLFVDYSDRLVPKEGFMKNHYPDLPYSKFQQNHIRFGLRCIVRGRIFRNGSTNYVKKGILLSPSWENMLSTDQGLPFHAPFAVRTDFVNSIQDLLPSMVAESTNAKSASAASSIPYHPAVSVDRPFDIVHLWEILLPSKNNDLRNLVTERVTAMGNLEHPIKSGKMIEVDTSIQGDRAHKGRWGVSDAYASTLLKAKIVIVSQRDQWEDHFRLFEALASGAMVLMDEMLSLPHSLKDGESVVFFRSLDEMQELALYYLRYPEERIEIARKGWEISMKKHRSWHRLEEMLFGKGVTKTEIRDSWFPTTKKR